jgi:hypothetical protein
MDLKLLRVFRDICVYLKSKTAFCFDHMSCITLEFIRMMKFSNETLDVSEKRSWFFRQARTNFKDKIAKVWIEFFIAGQGKDSSFTWKVQG